MRWASVLKPRRRACQPTDKPTGRTFARSTGETHGATVPQPCFSTPVCPSVHHLGLCGAFQPFPSIGPRCGGLLLHLGSLCLRVATLDCLGCCGRTLVDHQSRAAMLQGQALLWRRRRR